MMKKLLATVVGLAGCLTIPSAFAEPSMRASVAGSAIFIYMSNPEDRAYSCTISYTWAFDSFGDKVDKSETFQVFVPAKASEFQAQKNSGTYPNMRITGGPTKQCNPS